MKNTIKKKKQEGLGLRQSKGFTIIEVLIVLAIAGLIILIVFLAVPALQRNSRNTQRKNDVSAIGGAINEYVNNNSGQLPTDDGNFENNVLSNAKTSHYDKSSDTAIEFYRQTSASDRTPPTGTDTIHIHTFTKCNGNDDTTNGATARSVVALFRVETGGGDTVQCQEL